LEHKLVVDLVEFSVFLASLQPWVVQSRKYDRYKEKEFIVEGKYFFHIYLL
jgi:hypothetical protein